MKAKCICGEPLRIVTEAHGVVVVARCPLCIMPAVHTGRDAMAKILAELKTAPSAAN